MSEFAIKLDLSAYFNNICEKVMILVDPEWSNCSQVEKRLGEVFGLHDIALKTHEGYHIPSEESVKILKYVEVISVIPKTKTAEKRTLAAQHNIQMDVRKSKNKDLITSSPVPKKNRIHYMGNETNFARPMPALNLSNLIKSNSTTSSTLCTPMLCQISNIDELPVVDTYYKSINKRILNKPNGHENESSSKTHMHIRYDESGQEQNENYTKGLVLDAKPQRDILFCCDLEKFGHKIGRILYIGQTNVNESSMPQKNNLSKIILNI